MAWQLKVPQEGLWIVVTIWRNDDGVNGYGYTGPFKDENDAVEFMNCLPDDQDVVEMWVAFMNEVENTTDTIAM